MDHEHDTLNNVGDAVAGTVALATLFKWLPAVAAILSIIWTGIRIWEYIDTKRRGKSA